MSGMTTDLKPLTGLGVAKKRKMITKYNQNIMKRILSFCAVVAMLFASASCQQEIIPDGVNGDAVVSLSVAVPDAVTKAVGDGTNVDYLHYEIWSDDNGLGKRLLASGKERAAAKTFDLELTLVSDQTYHFLFWAQCGKDNSCYNVTDLTKVKVNYDNAAGNDESRAAFFAYEKIKVEGAVKKTIELKRPFAQLNFGTSTLKSSFMDENVTVSSSTITVKQPATVFDLVNGVGGTRAANDVVFTAGEFKLDPTTLSVSDKVYNYLSMNYFLVEDGTSTVDVDAEFVTDFGTVSHEFISVPVAENYRTNIVGDLLFNKADFEIIVDEKFNTPDNIVVSDDWAHISGYNYVVNGDAGELALKEILIHADAAADAATKAEGPVVTIDLDGDVYWKTEGSHGSSPLLPATSKISKVVINGNGNTFTATGAGVGSIRLANGGLLEFNDVNIVDKSVSYKESAWEFTYLEFAGNLAFNGCTFNSGAQFQTEGEEADLSASFEDCRFITNEESVYAVWISDGTTTFNGCSFEGTRGLKMHEAYGSDVKSVTIDGCWFGPLSEKPGIAIGTLNADTEVTITNSKFSGCQAGDQGFTTYETDTDTSTFKFKFENNEEFGDQNAMLKDALDNAAAGATVEVPAGEYTFPASDIKEGMTLKCAEGTVFTGQSNPNINGATIEGATFSNEGGSAVRGTVNGTFKDCVFDGTNGLRWCVAGETVVFENCVFSGDVYGAHFDGGANDIIFRNCTFSGFNAFGSAVTLITFDGCKFVANGRSDYNGANLWGSTTMINTEFTFDGSVSYEWIDCIGADKEYKFTGCTINGGSLLSTYYFGSRDEETDITVDGKLYENFATVTYLASAADMQWFANEVNANSNSFSGKTVKLSADINLAGIDWDPIGQTGATTFNGVFDGQNYTISNLSVDSEDQTGAHYSSGLFGWVESHTAGHGHIKNVKISGATVKGHHNCGALVGYITQETALVENCHVTGAAITCTYANNDADGDKAGALIGNATVATPVKDCTAANSTVSAGRDAGQVIGAGKEANVTGCSATEVTVTANGTGTGENVRNEVIGRLLK